MAINGRATSISFFGALTGCCVVILRLREGQEITQVVVDGCDTPAGFAIEGIADVVRSVHPIPFIDDRDGKDEFLALIEGVEHFVAGDADGACALDPTFDFDVAGVRLLAVDGRLDRMSGPSRTCPLRHRRRASPGLPRPGGRHPWRAVRCVCARPRRPQGSPPPDRWVSSPRSLLISPTGTTSAAPSTIGRAVDDVSHRLQARLPARPGGFRGQLTVRRAFSRLRRTSLSCLAILLELEPAVLPESDLLAEALMDSSERLVNMGNAPVSRPRCNALARVSQQQAPRRKIHAPRRSRAQ